ncbi:MAG: hypothetical protein NZM09_04025 [Ignavibacterium sp.]|nr:hypothetical protein [Ignavibacterium sp.]MDW8374844.1 hypothetical protein [Ignavibacteriales bacterium]
MKTNINLESIFGKIDSMNENEIMEYLKSAGYTEEKIEKLKNDLLKKVNTFIEKKLKELEYDERNKYLLAARDQKGNLEITEKDLKLLSELIKGNSKGSAEKKNEKS